MPSSRFLSSPSSGLTRSASGSSVLEDDVSLLSKVMSSSINGSSLTVMIGVKVSLCAGEGELTAEARLVGKDAV